MFYEFAYKILALIVTFTAAYIMTEYRLGILNLATEYSNADYVLIFAVNWVFLLIFYYMAWMAISALKKRYEDIRTRFK